MYEKQDGYDKLLLKKVRECNDQEAFTQLFNKYFPIVNTHLLMRFKKVRSNLLQDAAIETMEDWYFNYIDKWDDSFIGADLCRYAGSKVHGIIKNKFKVQPYSDFVDSEQDSFLDALVYHGVSGADLSDDLAKMTFQLKKKVDSYIELLSDRDYDVLTMFLDGDRKVDIAKKIGIKKIDYEIQTAFIHLKKLVDNNSKLSVKGTIGYSIEFERKRKIYMDSEINITHKEASDMYFNDQKPLYEISKHFDTKIKTVKSWIDRDFERVLNGGILKRKKPLSVNGMKKANFFKNKQVYLENKSANYKYPDILKLYFERGCTLSEISHKYNCSNSVISTRINRMVKGALKEKLHNLKQKFNKN